MDAAGKGTCAGVSQAAGLISAGKPFMLIWSDLILPEEYQNPAGVQNDYNRITVEGDVLVKEAVDIQGEKIARRKCAWYDRAVQNPYMN